ncbi:hypothetical protein [Actinomadura flavalba]|uniref:hypothetical protein n=1 Tax=Actinomadura flavalba TaxID=1120938 RepID=UPI0003655C2B|nr:hypothetical protein [Actinomadura flavalba]
MNGEASLWSPEMWRLTDLADLIKAGNWQRGGGRGQRPRPERRPSIPQRADDHDDDPDG